MLFLNKVLLLPSLHSLNKLLNYNIFINPSFYFCNDIIAINHKIINNDKNIIRIWKTNSWFYIFYNDFSTRKFIGALDYKINDDHIKIEYMNINDGENSNINDFILDSNDAIELNSSLINFIKNVAKTENKNKVIVDVHNNLRIFNKYYHTDNFKITSRRCSDNPYWLEAELNL